MPRGDYDTIAERTLRGYEYIYLLVRRDGYDLIADVGFEFHGRHAATRYIVHVQIYDIAAARNHSALLVAVGQEEILAVEAPVEERSMCILVHDLQAGDMAFGYERPLGCGHKAVLGVVIYEYALFVAHLVRE